MSSTTRVTSYTLNREEIRKLPHKACTINKAKYERKENEDWEVALGFQGKDHSNPWETFQLRGRSRGCEVRWLRREWVGTKWIQWMKNKRICRYLGNNWVRLFKEDSNVMQLFNPLFFISKTLTNKLKD